MKGTKLLLALLLAVIVTSVGCKKDDPYIEPDTSSTVNLNISTEINGTPVILGNTYYDVANYRYVPNTFKVYLSHISFLKADGTEVSASDVELIDLQYDTLGLPSSFNYQIPQGDYTGIKFWIGVDSIMNSIDPASYEADEPLSLYTGTYWEWNTGYRFMMLEGLYDTEPNGTDPINNGNTFSYHTGTNMLYKEADLSNAQQSFSLTDGANTYNYDLVLDMNKILYNDTDTIVIMNDRVTHTTDDVALAQEVTDNLAKAFSNKN